MNSGSCSDVVNGYMCECRTGFYGNNCASVFIPPAIAPCPPGFAHPVDDQGTALDGCVNIDECASNPCFSVGINITVNGDAASICLDGLDSFACMCPAGWGGELCDTEVDECASHPCESGVCEDRLDSYICSSCADGYAGFNCNIDIDECYSYPCTNGGECVQTSGCGYECTCSDGFSGDNCATSECEDECLSLPCLHGGECTDGVKSYDCSCTGGWTGDNCEIDIDECAPAPCGESGTCFDSIGSYVCVCDSSHLGRNCEYLVDQYPSSAVCADGFRGPTCQENIDDCAPNPCQNGGVCTDGVATHACDCPSTHGGMDCDQLVDSCDVFCEPGLGGAGCLEDIDVCQSFPCRNGGICQSGCGLDTYVCECAVGYDGEDCEVERDECLSVPCMNGGVCTDGLNSYSCICPDDWSGYNCMVDVDSCASSPCVTGTCTDSVVGYTCECEAGTVGRNCEYTPETYPGCDESNGFTGINCDENIDECAPGPCLHAGICTDGIGGYKCDCPSSHGGAS